MDHPLTYWDIEWGDVVLRVEECPRAGDVMPRHHGKCESCGATEYRQHAGRSVCSYCRSEA